MDLKIYSTIALSILVFALIAGIATTFENVYAQGEDENTGGTTNGTTGGNTGEATDEIDGGDDEESKDEDE